NVDPRFREIERDLAARIAESDNEHALAREELRVAVAARMQNRAVEPLRAGPCRRVRIIGPSGRDDDGGGAPCGLARLGAQLAPVASNGGNRGVRRPAPGRTWRRSSRDRRPLAP